MTDNMDEQIQEETELPAESATSQMSLELLASQFVDEYRRWLNPSVEDYATAYAEYADEIRESFPVLIAMEQWKGNQEVSQLQHQLPEDFCFTQLGDCRIIRELSRSRTSVIYEAEQGALGRKVAVKVLLWKSERSPRWQERFEREARLVARLRHPNIISIYSTGEDQGYCYSVMHFVDGVGLDDIIQRLAGEGTIRPGEIVQQDSDTQLISLESTQPVQNPAPVGAQRTLRRNAWRAFASLGLQIANAVRYAHEQGTLHNDIKSENILLDGKGKAWLTDFSLAQFAEGKFQQQNINALCYMAPERFKGEINEQSDLYSLGMVLYELATLTTAFSSSNMSLLTEKISTMEPLPPREINANIPIDFETIILNAIAKSQQQRYQTTEELSLDLLRFMNGEKVRRRELTQDSTTGKWFEFWKHNKGPQG